MAFGRKKRGLKYKDIELILNSLCLAYKERDRNKSSYRIDIPLFGIRVRLEGYLPPPDVDDGWDVLYVAVDVLRESPRDFVEPLMWSLIEKGYLAYIREADRGMNGRIFRTIVIDSGWGQKILEKRIELCGDKPKYTFMKMRMEEFLTAPVPRIIAHYPGFFDYLF